MRLSTLSVSTSILTLAPLLATAAAADGSTWYLYALDQAESRASSLVQGVEDLDTNNLEDFASKLDGANWVAYQLGRFAELITSLSVSDFQPIVPQYSAVNSQLVEVLEGLVEKSDEVGIYKGRVGGYLQAIGYGQVKAASVLQDYVTDCSFASNISDGAVSFASAMNTAASEYSADPTFHVFGLNLSDCSAPSPSYAMPTLTNSSIDISALFETAKAAVTSAGSSIESVASSPVTDTSIPTDPATTTGIPAASAAIRQLKLAIGSDPQVAESESYKSGFIDFTDSIIDFLHDIAVAGKDLAQNVPAVTFEYFDMFLELQSMLLTHLNSLSDSSDCDNYRSMYSQLPLMDSAVTSVYSYALTTASVQLANDNNATCLQESYSKPRLTWTGVDTNTTQSYTFSSTAGQATNGAGTDTHLLPVGGLAVALISIFASALFL